MSTARGTVVRFERASVPEIQPMRLRRVREPFDHPDWLFELKRGGHSFLGVPFA